MKTLSPWLSVCAFAAIAGLLFELTMPVALADTFSSSHFLARDPTTDGFGGYASSTSFSSVDYGSQNTSGEATSTSFILHGGYAYFDSLSLQSKHWQWFDDEADETPTLSLAAENVAPSGLEPSNIIKLRLTIADAGGATTTNQKFRLQYSQSSTFDTASDVTEQSSCTVSSEWCYADGAGVDNAKITTSVLSDSDSCVSGVGSGCGTHNESGTSTSSFSQPANASTEYEFTITAPDPIPGAVYFFRAYDVGGASAVPLGSGESYPSLSAGGGTLSFSIDGLPAATTTAGVTTNIDTTSTTVPFGTLSFASSTIAAHRLTVTTNATNGYRIFAYEGQGLVNQSNAAIPPVAASNDAPAAWQSGCDTASQSGCWGYHTDAPVLSGGSTRFAPDDTYAGFTSDPSEVAYSAGPAATSTTDIVYRVQITDHQESGDYTSNLVYIVTPVF